MVLQFLPTFLFANKYSFYFAVMVFQTFIISNNLANNFDDFQHFSSDNNMEP
jgi:hypothetical protein